MAQADGLLHDPVSGTSRRVRATCVGEELQLTGDAVDRRVALSALSAAGGGWDGRSLHLTWTEGGHAFALTLEPEGGRELAAAFPAPLAADVERLLQSARRYERRGRRTLPIVLFVFVGLPLLALLSLYLMRDRLIEAVVRRLPTTVDGEVGKLLEQQLSGTGKLLKDGPAVEAVRALGGRLVAASPDRSFTFRFEVMRDPSVNAFAAPGGLVVVHTGLLAAARTPEEVAGVLSHEVVHVLHRHSMRQMVFAVGLDGAIRLLVGSPDGAAAMLAGTAFDLTSLGFSRDQERDADLGGLDLLQRARMPAQGLIGFFDTLKKEGGAPPPLLSSHPPAEDRAARLEEELRRRGEWPVEPITLDWAAVQAASR